MRMILCCAAIVAAVNEQFELAKWILAAAVAVQLLKYVFNYAFWKGFSEKLRAKRRV